MSKLGFLVFFLVLFTIITLCGARAMSPATNALPSIDVATLQKRLEAPNPPFLLDVREPSEFEGGHIKGAKLIPLGTLPDHVAEIPKDKPVVVICRSGNRSARAASFLIEHGYGNVENLTGGMSAWASKCETNKSFC